MPDSKPNIVISLPLVWSIRNFIVSGITEKLSLKYNIYFAVDENNRSILQAYLGRQDNLLTIQKGQGFGLISSILHKAFQLEHKELGYIPTIMKKGGVANSNYTLRSRTKEFFVTLVARFVLCFNLFAWLEDKWFTSCGKNPNATFVSDLQKINPVFILSTTFVIGTEWPLIFYAWATGVQIYTHVLSFDNITSRGYIPIGKFDKYFVWSERMKVELMKYYKVQPEKVFITGTPQFDFHNSEIFKRSRSETLGMFGLQNDDHYLLYCANHVILTPGEPELFASIVNRIQSEIFSYNYKIIIRLHPLDIYNRWQDLLNKYKDTVRVSIPWSHPVKENPALGLVTKDDMVRFINLLSFADVVLNIASTISIDASIVDTPVICIGYHPSKPEESKCYFGYHYSEHYKTLMDFGATPLASNEIELIELLKRETNDRLRLSENREQLASYYVQEYKKNSAEKLVNILLND